MKAGTSQVTADRVVEYLWHGCYVHTSWLHVVFLIGLSVSGNGAAHTQRCDKSSEVDCWVMPPDDSSGECNLSGSIARRPDAGTYSKLFTLDPHTCLQDVAQATIQLMHLRLFFKLHQNSISMVLRLH